MSQQEHKHHSIDYIEFPVTDMEQAKNFYRSLFQWEFNDYAPGYAGIKKGDGEAGGLSLQEEKPARGGPLVILYSQDLDKTYEEAKKLKAEIVIEPFEFPGGRRFHLLDPSGNEIAVWSTL